MTLRLRPSILTAAFALLFALMANLAWATAITTTGPWFGPSVSLTVYSVTLVLGTLLGVVLVQQASARVARFDASLARLNRRIALLRASSPEAQGRPWTEDSELRLDVDGFADGGSRTLVRAEKEGHDSLVSVPEEPHAESSTARIALLRQLVRERIGVREARARTWPTVAGPVLMTMAFLAIAGPMLPAADGFASAHYVLNTTLILFLAYGFAPLVAWSLIALALLSSPDRGAPL